LVQANAKGQAILVATPIPVLFLPLQPLFHPVTEMHRSSPPKSDPSILQTASLARPHQSTLAGELALVLQEHLSSFYAARGLFPEKYVRRDPVDQALQSLLIVLGQGDQLFPGTFLPIRSSRQR